MSQEQHNPRPGARPASRPGTAVAARAPSAARIETNSLLMAEQHWNRLNTIATRAFRSRVLPKSIDSEEKAFIVALKGVALGLEPMYAMEHIAVVNGKATIDGQAMLALIYMHSDVMVSFEKTERPDQECAVTMKRRGSEFTARWTMERAKRAGITGKDVWKNYPEQMLRWRAVSEAARIIAPDIIGGMYLHEEIHKAAAIGEQGEIIEAEFTVEKTAPTHATASQKAPPPASPEEATAAAPTAAAPAPSQPAESVIPAGSSATPAGTPSAGGTAEVPPAPAEALGPDEESFLSSMDEPVETADAKGRRLGFDSGATHANAVKALWAKARSCGWSEDDVRQYLAPRGIASTKDMPWAELNNFMKHVEGNRKRLPGEEG